MLNLLLNLKNSLEQNWTYLHKILFTFSFYLLYKVFLKVLPSEAMSPFILLFIIAGFIVFTIDILVYPLIYIFIQKKNEQLNENSNIANYLVYFNLLIATISTILYYSTHIYAFVSVIIFGLIMAALSYSYFLIYKSNGKIVKTSILFLAIIGLAGIVHSFYLNEDLNVNSFSLFFILGFFILDFFIFKWRKR